jgi:hypothetical protein
MRHYQIKEKISIHYRVAQCWRMVADIVILYLCGSFLYSHFIEFAARRGFFAYEGKNGCPVLARLTVFWTYGTSWDE